MIEVRIGTTDALEVREDVDGNQTVHHVDGEKTISFLMPDGVGSMDASTQVIGALNGVMMEIGAKPWWIESNDQAVAANLVSHYGPVLEQKPENWGDGTTSAPEGTQQKVYEVPAPPPDPQLPSAPTVEPEPEPEPEAQEPEPEPEVEGETPEEPVGDL